MTLRQTLEKLEDVHQSGALSDEVFARAKERILASTPPHAAPVSLAVQTANRSPLSQGRSSGVDGQPKSNAETSWLPSQDVTDFNGNPLSGNLDFFVSPPLELGTIYCAFSTLKRGQVPMEPNARFGWAVGAAVLGAVIGSGLS